MPDCSSLAVDLTEQGLAKFAAGDREAALADFEAALELDPACVKALVNRGSIKNLQGHLLAAAEDFSRAIELDPRMAAAYSNRGAVRIALWEFAAAVADFDAALTLDPDNCQAYLMRSYARYHQRDTAAGERDIRRAFGLNPAYTAEFIVGQIVWSLEQGAAQLFRDCENHLRGEPGDFHSLARRGLAFLLQGRAEEAERDFAAYRRLNPEGSYYLDLLIQQAESIGKTTPRAPG